MRPHSFTFGEIGAIECGLQESRYDVRLGDVSLTPPGVTAISRGLSAATPPVHRIQRSSSTPAGVADPPRHSCDPYRGRKEAFVFGFRGYRCAQPPANRCDPAGVDSLRNF